jgi:integrase
MRKMHRKLGRACDQAYGITATTLDKLLVSAGVGFRGLRDRALLMLAYDTMRRRSELVSLRIADIEPNPIGAVIRLRRSKTDQEAAGTWLHISAATYRAITAWLEAAELKEGFLLRGVMGNGTLTEQLGGGQIGRIYKRLAQLAGLPEKVVSDISGHSLRVGAAQDLLQNGASLPQIMAKGGWAKTDTVMRYVERTSVAAIHVSAHFG